MFVETSVAELCVLGWKQLKWVRVVYYVFNKDKGMLVLGGVGCGWLHVVVGSWLVGWLGGWVGWLVGECENESDDACMMSLEFAVKLF
jgi:hypothetical protein